MSTRVTGDVPHYFYVPAVMAEKARKPPAKFSFIDPDLTATTIPFQAYVITTQDISAFKIIG